MKTEVKVALIAAGVSLLTALIGQALTVYRVNLERDEWIASTAASNQQDLYRARLSVYPSLHKLLGNLSSRRIDQITPDICREFSDTLNDWYYTHGVIVSSQLRNAILTLRNACIEEPDKAISEEEVRRVAGHVHIHMRRDLGLRRNTDPIRNPRQAPTSLENAKDFLERALE